MANDEKNRSSRGSPSDEGPISGWREQNPAEGGGMPTLPAPAGALEELAATGTLSVPQAGKLPELDSDELELDIGEDSIEALSPRLASGAPQPPPRPTPRPALDMLDDPLGDALLSRGPRPAAKPKEKRSVPSPIASIPRASSAPTPRRAVSTSPPRSAHRRLPTGVFSGRATASGPEKTGAASVAAANSDEPLTRKSPVVAAGSATSRPPRPLGLLGDLPSVPGAKTAPPSEQVPSPGSIAPPKPRPSARPRPPRVADSPLDELQRLFDREIAEAATRATDSEPESGASTPPDRARLAPAPPPRPASAPVTVERIIDAGPKAPSEPASELDVALDRALDDLVLDDGTDGGNSDVDEPEKAPSQAEPGPLPAVASPIGSSSDIDREPQIERSIDRQGDVAPEGEMRDLASSETPRPAFGAYDEDDVPERPPRRTGRIVVVALAAIATGLGAFVLSRPSNDVRDVFTNRTDAPQAPVSPEPDVPTDTQAEESTPDTSPEEVAAPIADEADAPDDRATNAEGAPPSEARDVGAAEPSADSTRRRSPARPRNRQPQQPSAADDTSGATAEGADPPAENNDEAQVVAGSSEAESPPPTAEAEPSQTTESPAALIAKARRASPDVALTLYQQAAELEPNNARAHEGLARIYLSRRDTSRAIEHAERALSSAPKTFSYLLLLGDAKAAAGDTAGARAAWEEARSVDPDNPRLGRRLEEPAPEGSAP